MRGCCIALAIASGGCPPPVLESVGSSALESEGLASPPEAVDLDPVPGVLSVELVASHQLRPVEGGVYDGFAYNDQVPGPTLRLRVGDTLTVKLTNQTDLDTSIHWHGLEVPYGMDGAGWQVAPVHPEESFTYSFSPKQAGTFWYHPHFNTARQVDGGLFGVIVVLDPAEPEADLDLVLVFDLFSEYQPAEPEVGKADSHEHGHGGGGGHGLGFEGDWLVNNQRSPVLTVKGGSRVRARLVNVASSGYLDLGWPAMRVIAGDQGLGEALETPERLLLGPGDRAEVEWLVGQTGFEVKQAPYSLHGGPALGDEKVVLTVVVDTPAPVPSPLGFSFGGAASRPDPGHTDILYAFAGSSRSGEWLINGEKFPEVTIEAVPFGEERVIEVRNLSPTEHPFHLHGLRMEMLSVDGVAPTTRTFADTVNLPIRSVVRFLIEADNFGDWMAHCHILSHAEEGMMTVLRVQGPN
jgi:FtsP/CotA-like multicopper oxidase with cupredoxin domain